MSSFHRGLLAAAVASWWALACGGDDGMTGTGGNGDGNGNGGGTQTQETSVSVRDNLFDPDQNTISAGQTVTWTWAGSNSHNVTFDDAGIGNSVTQSAGSFQKTFSQTGNFTYYCTVHGRAVMSGEVVAQ